MNLEQKKFEEWKRRHGKLDEGFLDGNDDLETADVPSEDAATEEEKDLSEEPSEDDAEGGDEQPETDSTEGDAPAEEGGDNSGENLDDFGEGEGEAETQTDDGVEKEAEDTTELKDVLTTLTTAVQALTDKIDTMNAETGDEGGEEAPAEGGDETAMDDFDSEEGGEEAPAEETSEGGEEGGEGEGESTEGGESEGGEGESSEGGEGESSEEAPADETKSENFNFYHKKGQPLDEDSDYIIGKLYEDRFDKLEPFIMSALKMKIRNHIEEYKKQVRMDAISKKLEK